MEENKLQKRLTHRHITMLALGGAIGAGLFKGSGAAIGIAGPSVLIAFLLGGLILLIVMRGLGQLVLSGSKGGGMSGLIEPVVGSRAADFVDWVYWMMWMINIIAEAVAAASFLQLWFPHTPAWVFVLLLALLTTAINLYSVKLFAETEYWLAWAKISIIIVLIAFGIYLVAQLFLTDGFVGTFQRMNSHGGFAPNGIKGLMASMLVVIYSYGGSELIAITVSETEDPKTAIPRAIKGVLGRIVAFYIIPLALLLVIYSWKTLATTSVSPFVMVFQKMHIPFAADFVNFIIVLALFSSINSGVYASSRTLFFRMRNSTGVGKRFAKLTKHGVPQRAVLFCIATLYVGVILSYVVGDNLFSYLTGSLSYIVLTIWLMISYGALALFIKQKRVGQAVLISLAMLALFVIAIGIFVTSNKVVSILTFIMYGVILLNYQRAKKKKAA
jgi:AAT family amino acid transporter